VEEPRPPSPQNKAVKLTARVKSPTIPSPPQGCVYSGHRIWGEPHGRVKKAVGFGYLLLFFFIFLFAVTPFDPFLFSPCPRANEKIFRNSVSREAKQRAAIVIGPTTARFVPIIDGQENRATGAPSTSNTIACFKAYFAFALLERIPCPENTPPPPQAASKAGSISENCPFSNPHADFPQCAIIPSGRDDTGNASSNSLRKHEPAVIAVGFRSCWKSAPPRHDQGKRPH